MISIKSEYELSLMKRASKIVYETHKYLRPFIKPGITTKELNDLAHDFIISKDAYPSCLNYEGYPASICISINEEVVHGIPSKRKLKNGDIVTLDICACYKGYHGDSAWSYAVGDINEEKKYLLLHTEKALYEGLSKIKPGIHIGDVSNAIEEYATSHKLGVVRELVGHGIGSKLHEDPEVPNYGKKGTGPILQKGMTIAVEPMLNLGTRKVYLLDDDWTIVTGDNKPSAHFEHTIVVTDDGYEILTGDDNHE
ncbi:MAG: type I methionyl aminopeptidase [Bacilli bacterium]|nr:type I methionyl aminopeptidase [Bacilli bacterium]